MRAIITGAASGIGRATALRLAQDGAARDLPARLLLVDLDTVALRPVVEAVAARGGVGHMIGADLADLASAETIAARALTDLGGLDALVSNAGYFPRTTLLDLTLDEYERMFAVNTRATWLLAKHCHAMLAASRGAIVATASISASQPTPGIGNYSACKAALVMLVRQLALELGPDGIRCNCVSPGTTRTGINDFLLSDPDVRAAREAMLPLGRIGQPEDLAGAISFLVGADSTYITGVDLLVDGGLNATLMPSLARSTKDVG